jgi:hypothetical protein
MYRPGEAKIRGMRERTESSVNNLSNGGAFRRHRRRKQPTNWWDVSVYPSEYSFEKQHERTVGPKEFTIICV